MSKQTINFNFPGNLINVGRVANDRSGDPLRTAFDKLNDAVDKIDSNFQELYAAVGADSLYHLGDDIQFIDIDPVSGMIVIQSGFDTGMPVYIKGANCSDGGVGGNVVIEAGGAPLPNTGTTGNIEMAAQQTTIDSNNNLWTFRDDGVLELPPGGDIVDSNGDTVLGGGGGGPDFFNTGNSNLTLHPTQIQIGNNLTGYEVGDEGSGIYRIDAVGESYVGTVDRFYSVATTFLVNTVNVGANSFTVFGNAVSAIADSNRINVDGFFSINYSLPILGTPTYDSGTGRTTIVIDDFDGDTVNVLWGDHKLRCVEYHYQPYQLAFSEAFTFNSLDGNLVRLKDINTLTNGAKSVSLGSNGVLTLPSNNYIETTDANLKIGSQGIVTIRSNAQYGETTKSWVFGTDGDLEIPGNITSKNNPQVGSTATAGEPTYSYNGTTLAVFAPEDFTVGTLSSVQAGWTVTNNNGFTDTIVSVGDPMPGSITTTSVYWPTSGDNTYVFTSPDYTPASINDVVLEAGTASWAFNSDGGLTFPNNSAFDGQTLTDHASSANYTLKIANGNVAGSKFGIGTGSASFGVANDALNHAEDGYVPYSVTASRINLTVLGAGSWQFDNNGYTQFPGGGFIGWDNTSTSPAFNGTMIGAALGDDFNVQTIGGLWKFGADGNLTLPGTGTITNPSDDGGPVGTIHTFTADYNGDTNGLASANSIRLPGGSPANTIQENWIITFANGTTKTVTTSIVALPDNWDLFWSGSLTIASGADVWPLTVQSADYSAGTTTKSLELTPDGTTTWTFGDDGNLILPTGGTVSYTPATSSDWDGDPPTTMQEAIDRLAAAFKILNNGTGA